jgi:hypothetical protein
MPVDIPDLYAAHADLLTTCGTIATKSKKLHKWASDHDQEYYYYHHGTANGDLAVRVSLDSNKNKGTIHFHIDIYGKSCFPAGQLPEPSQNAPTFEDLLAPFLGHTVDVTVFIDFFLALSRAPSFISVIAKQAVSKDNVSIRMTGGVLSLEGAPVETIRWSVDRKDEKRVLISLIGHTLLKYSDAYFKECFQLIMSFARTLLELEDTNA